MKKYLMLIITIVMIMSALAVMAQNEKSYTITPRFVYNFLTNSDTSDMCNDMYGILVDFDMVKYPVGLEAGYLYSNKDVNKLKYTGSNEITATSIPLLVTYKYPINDAFYARVGVGASFNNFKVSDGLDDSTTELAWEIKAGYKFSKNWSAELGYADYGNLIDEDLDNIKFSGAAIQANVGYSF